MVELMVELFIPNYSLDNWTTTPVTLVIVEHYIRFTYPQK